jgi:glycosyltransferase involved in cell wall biosynthesis
MKVAYVLGTYPSLTETFIQREIDELRRQGVDVVVFALRRPAVDSTAKQRGKTVGTEPAPPEYAQGACSSTLEGRPPCRPMCFSAESAVCYRPSLFSPSLIAATAHFLARHPLRLLRTVGQALVTAGPHPVQWLKYLRNVPAAAFFARRAAALGVRHVHAHFAFMPADVARMMAELLGKGFSFGLHAADIYLQNPAALSHRLRAARFATVCTRYGYEEVVRKVGPDLPAKKLHVLYHGLPAAREDARPPSVGSADGQPLFGVLAPSCRGEGERPREPLILGIGRLQPKKGFITLIGACRLLHERGVAFRCQIAGEGPERQRLADAIARSHLDAVVRLSGAQTQEQIAGLLREARVLAAPCLMAPDGDRDSLPNVILEAMAAGVPVVSTPIAGIPEAIEHGRDGLLVPPEDAPALASRIEELLKNEGLCRMIAFSGRATAAERFDIARNVGPLVKLFEQMHDNLRQESLSGRADH